VSLKTLEAVRELIGDTAGRGVTQIEDMLICRAIDSRSDKLRSFFEQVWKIVREDALERTMCTPRIWAT
jgi:urease accessory protein